MYRIAVLFQKCNKCYRVKTSLRSVISVHFFELFSVFPRKPIYIINKCYYRVVDIYNTLADDEEILLQSVQQRHCSVNLRTDTIMPTELGAITRFKIYHKITNKTNREVQYINYIYIEFRFSSYFLLIIILITEKLFVEAKFACVVS